MEKQGVTLVADSGSTKTDWALCRDGRMEAVVETEGINPVHQTEREIEATLCRARSLMPLQPQQVFFYGAGCRDDLLPLMHRLIGQTFQCEAEVASDLLGAARALCGRGEGIASILGTGSNSCLYDGEKIVANVAPLGYILGDEGSGAALGRLFLRALLRGELPQAIADEFGLSASQVIERIYRQPQANRFLATTSPFIRAHIGDPRLRDIVKQNFRNFFRHCIATYSRPDLPVNVVGSIAAAYESELRETANEEGFSVGTVVKKPLEGMLRFLQN